MCFVRLQEQYGKHCAAGRTYLVDSCHHGKDSRVCDGGGVNACLGQLAGKCVAQVTGCPLCHHYLHQGTTGHQQQLLLAMCAHR